ncbi:hypothetical protein [Cytobacillus sp. IB215665]|uniref:hypothetical protein n=1 Tax=Cytobacillus sp. IB215665 TaxID=3097357 RepID=UPI002A0AE9F6|nr:hypothetical protein [Cytobacillus sp. IB215665]MDX8367811.1 hypothetical protein [Cytobacillus sp. IB215665]
MTDHENEINSYIEEMRSSDLVEVQPFSMLPEGKRLIFKGGREVFIYYCPVNNCVKTSAQDVVGVT